jgi:hypothetical protein
MAVVTLLLLDRDSMLRPKPLLLLLLLPPLWDADKRRRTDVTGKSLVECDDCTMVEPLACLGMAMGGLSRRTGDDVDIAKRGDEEDSITVEEEEANDDDMPAFDATTRAF